MNYEARMRGAAASGTSSRAPAALQLPNGRNQPGQACRATLQDIKLSFTLGPHFQAGHKQRLRASTPAPPGTPLLITAKLALGEESPQGSCWLG